MEETTTRGLAITFLALTGGLDSILNADRALRTQRNQGQRRKYGVARPSLSRKKRAEMISARIGNISFSFTS